jgi:uncharacterized protein
MKVIVFGTRKPTLKIIDEKSWFDIKKGNLKSVDDDLLEVLKNDLILVEDEKNEVDLILEENKNYIDNSKHLYFSVQPTANCPLGCGYCGQLHSPKKMSLQVQDLLVQRMKSKLLAKNYESLSISWFGGEPISGFSVIETLAPRIIDLAEEFGLTYSAKIVTNGMLLNPEIIQKLSQDFKVLDFEITLDGMKEYHDNRRHTKAKGETFDIIYSNIILLSKNPSIRITIRCNVDQTNHKGVSPLIQKLRQDNLHERVSFYVAPIHSWGNDAHKISAEKNQFSEWEIEWLLELKELGFNVSYLPHRKKSVCFAVQSDNELISPDGEIYGCSEVSLVPFYEKNGENIHKLGHVSDKEHSYDSNKNVFNSFYDKNHLKRFNCISCELLPVCGGSCPKEWEEGRIPCPSIKFNIKNKLLLYYLEHRKKILDNSSNKFIPEFFIDS